MTTMTATPMTADNFAKDARVVLSVLSGYKLTQHRPRECQASAENGWHSACRCGEGCHGTTTLREGTSQGVIYWADNSIEATVACDDGEVRIARLKPPSGDACF